MALTASGRFDRNKRQDVSEQARDRSRHTTFDFPSDNGPIKLYLEKSSRECLTHCTCIMFYLPAVLARVLAGRWQANTGKHLRSLNISERPLVCAECQEARTRARVCVRQTVGLFRLQRETRVTTTWLPQGAFRRYFQCSPIFKTPFCSYLMTILHNSIIS